MAKEYKADFLDMLEILLNVILWGIRNGYKNVWLVGLNMDHE
jgi:hypothetical protein